MADGRGRTVCSRFVNGELDKIPWGHVPIFVTDGYKPYQKALFDRYSYEVWNTGRGRRGCHREPSSALNYGIVEKTREGRKLRSVHRYVAYGHVPEEFLNTSAIERQNLTLRCFCSRLRRRSITFGRNRQSVQDCLDLLKSNYNLCTPHASLSLSKKENNGKRKAVTPAMEIGLTDHVWSIGEVMSFLYRQISTKKYNITIII
ncbi:MAG: hypothetical protein J5933_03765 [Clostridia bacterium]|nr:hypothetical protein [Clostridia bacterium]